ncbi:MAG: hypothetical protein BGO55_03480 [Sphingobacteriales bacterium 50-39]|nr:hypothetical protein [Sphingobacteriales bacterium]OJW55614.1 MAG: hypothetical protein BGO55_03480 [Sphingobacteriales bacterium 50-39]
MSKYITRVQLKNAAEEDYKKLDVEMEKGLFVKVAQPLRKVSLDGMQEYNYRGMTSLQAVVTAAYTAASRTGKQYSLTVMKEKRVPA